jgi:hypothetical protein
VTRCCSPRFMPVETHAPPPNSPGARHQETR